jgi:hypothetical protein
MIDGEITTESTKESGLIAQEMFYDAPELRHLVNVPQSADSNAIYTSTLISSTDPVVDPDYSMWGTEAASVNYVGLIPYLVKAIQELNTEVKYLRTHLG